VAIGPGTRLGPYEVTALLGAGGMGEVYRARDARLKRDVAIKILPTAFAQDPDRIRRFEHEAEALAALNHPNIAAIHTLEESNGIRFLVLELVEGETLSDRLRKGPLSPNEVTSIGLQICAALSAAHDKGIVHRDLKPANIKITPGGQAKLLDFGLARVFAADTSPSDLSHSPTITVPSAGHVIAGTAAYMAPEQARGKVIDKRADMWALGCVLYEMLSGRPLFAGESVTDILAAVLTQEPTLDDLPANASPQMRWVISRCLQSDPAARFRDAADAAAVFGAPSEPVVVQRFARRRWIEAVAGLTAAIAVTAFAVSYFRSFKQPQPQPLIRFDIPAPGASILQPMALSPDGKRVVFVVAAAAANRNALWIRSLDGLDAKMIAGTEAGRELMSPAWSPDSRSIAFVADGKLKRIDANGGMAQTLVTLDSQVGGITWNRDDVILFASNEHGLRYVSASGGPVTTVTERDASLDETYHDCPVFLPDGRRFLYLAYSETKPENRAVYVGSLDSNGRTRLMTSDWCVMYAKPGFLVFPQGQTLMARPFDAGGIKLFGDAVPIVDGVATNPNGEVAAFDVSDGGTLVYRKAAPLETTSSLIWADRNGKISDPVGASIQPGGGPTMRLSPDGKRVAFNTGIDGGRDDIWVLDVERNVRVRVTNDPGLDHVPVWSPDGSRLIFDSHRRGKGSALYEIPSDGAVPERVLLQLDDEAFIAATDWSRDGQFLVFHKSASGGPPWAIWLLPLVVDRKPIPYKMSSFDNIGARLSPNGRWLAYSTNESGIYQIVVQPFPNPAGGKWQVSTNGGTLPVWRRDGRELYYLAPSGELIAVMVNAESAFTIGISTTLFRTPIPPTSQGSPYAVTADGQRFLLAVPSRAAATPITTIVNWESLATKPDR
jgi:Tol biopolymer transport system component